jgi:hypothetical protein
MASWILVFYPRMPFGPSNIFVLESVLFSLFNMTGLGNKGNVVISKYHTLDHPTLGVLCCNTEGI